MPSAVREGPESWKTTLFGFDSSRSPAKERFSTRIDIRHCLYACAIVRWDSLGFWNGLIRVVDEIELFGENLAETR